MHSQLEEFLVILSAIPSFFLHHSSEPVQFIRECVLRRTCIEFKSFLLCERDNLRSKLSRQGTHLTENHVPCILVDGSPASLSLEDVHEVHQSRVLHILAERSDERRITKTRPYIFHFLEKHDHKLVKSQLSLSLGTEGSVDCAMETFEVSHHRTHHSSRQTTADKKRTHMRIVRVDPISEEVIDELLGQGTHLHVCVHVQVLYREAVSLEHLTDGDHIRMDLAP